MTVRGWGVLLLALAACDARPKIEGLPEGRPTPFADLGTGSGSLAWRALDALEGARITLAADPAAPKTGGTFTLEGPWEAGDGGMGRLRAWVHPLPFHNEMPRPNYAPHGARVFRGARELPFVNEVSDLRAGGWYVEKGDLVVLSLEDPRKWSEPAELRAPELVAAQRRRSWEPDGGIAPAAFVRTDVTIGGVTRPGLHLPVGGVVAFDVDVPAGATLTWGLAPLPDPLGQDEAEGGAKAVVRVDGAVLAEDAVDPGDGVDDRAASLEAWAGKRVTIELLALPGSGAGRGHVVFTAPAIRKAPARPVRRVVVVGIDTLRQDALGVHGYGRATSPELDAWAEQFVVFDNAWAPAPRTRPSFRTALTGRYPLAAVQAPTLAERLAPLGFRTGGVVANVHLVPRFGFNAGFEHWQYENGARADVQVDRALAWLREHEEEDSFLFLHLMDPHTWYNAPEPYGSRFQEAPRPKGLPELFDRWAIYKLMRAKGGLDDAKKAWVRGAYDGEVAWLSAQLSRFLVALDTLPGETLTVVHSDHGEEFWDHGAYEHNHSLYDELVRAVLWVRPPGGWGDGPHRVEAPVGLIDIVPSVLDAVGAPASGVDGRTLRPFFDDGARAGRDGLAKELAARPLVLGHLMFGRERWGVVAEGHKYVLHTASGDEELYDLGEDPVEKEDLAGDAARLARMREALAKGTGWPVRAGWRLELSTKVPFRVVFDAPIAGAGVIDPEAQREVRANLEWGDSPAVLPAEVATVRVSPDARVVDVLPGPSASGHRVWIACAAACPPGRLTGPSGEAPLADGTIQAGGAKVSAWAGTLLLQETTEAEALTAPEGGQMEALEQLGYVEH